MKHIFTVHSPITFLLVEAIIKIESICANDVVIIVNNFKVPEVADYKCVSFKTWESARKKVLYRFNLARAFDGFVDAFTHGERFVAYIDLMHNYQRILVTHNNCIGFSFFEEGTASYVRASSFFQLTRTTASTGLRESRFKSIRSVFHLWLRGFNTRLVSLPFQPDAYKNLPNILYYTLSEDGFPDVDNDQKIIIEKSIILNISKKYNVEFSKFKNAILFIEEPFYYNNGFTELQYRQAIIYYCKANQLKSSSLNVIVKLRPKQALVDSIIVDVLKNQGIEFEVYQSVLPIELVLVSYPKIEVVGVVSSLLYYASLWGGHSISLISKFPAIPLRFRDWNFYWSQVKTI